MPRSALASNAQSRHFLDVNPVAVRRFDATALDCKSASSSNTRNQHSHTKPAHATHAHATLVYHIEGETTFEQNGVWKLTPGDVMLIPAGQPHRRVSAEQATYWGMGICMPCFSPDEGLTLLNPFEHVRNGGSAVASIAPARRAYTISLFQELAVQSNATQNANHAVQRSLVTLILNEVVSARSVGERTLTRESGVVSDALQFIERNCLQPLTLQHVARAVNRSPAYVTTALSQATGKSAGEWIVAYRMAEARSLLRHSNERVSAIAERVGYNDTTHFIRMFRRDAGVTPAAFRAGLREPTQPPYRG